MLRKKNKNKYKNFFSKTTYLFFSILLFFLFIIIFFSFKDLKNFSKIDELMNCGFITIEVFKNKSITFFESIFYTEVKKTNEKLEKKILEYEEEIIRLKNADHENKILRNFFCINEKNDFFLNVIIPKFTSINYVVLEDIKNINEIKVGAAVISVDGYFGKVTGKLGKNLTVLLANSIKSRIPIVSEKSKLKAILFGKNSNYFEVKYVTKDENEIFIENESLKEEFIDGEFLLTFPVNQNEESGIKVAKIIKNEFGEISAKWVNENIPRKFIGIISKNKILNG